VNPRMTKHGYVDNLLYGKYAVVIREIVRIPGSYSRGRKCC